ncbi:glyoxalase superfamily protein [Thioclava sp. 15-R06ZXC-3]|uniref:Glyoxalase superfamily protein n=1 Tax=Thioclava arctica TaxID=3238301 RepID=A0ABV3TJW0_9RHOB
MSTPLPSLAAAKAEAKRLRAGLRVNATEISHSESLERLAHRHGFRDWNGLSAAIAAQSSKGFTPGGRVQGRYLSQPFTATIRNATMLWPGWFRLELDLDEAVDVVTSEAFSNFRKRISATVGPDGYSRERTSDGRPQMEITL